MNTQEQTTVKRLPNGAKLINSSAWRWMSKAEQETMISRIVLAQMGDDYVTWEECQEVTALGEVVYRGTNQGNYGKDLIMVEKGFQERAKRNIKYGGSALVNQPSYETAK